MEIYKITCKINNKVYIGSTKLTKEKRWGDLSSSSSHLSCVRDGIDKPLYNDIRKYGKENFKLETIEYVYDKSQRFIREDFWIKKYWNELGKNMMYNKWDLAYGCRDWSVPHNPEIQKKAAMIRREKYGNSNACMITPDALQKAKQTKMQKYGTCGAIVSEKGRRIHDIKVSNKFFDIVKGNIVIGYKGACERLKQENYNLTYWQVRRVIEGKQCKKTLLKYPELEGRFVLYSNHKSNR